MLVPTSICAKVWEILLRALTNLTFLFLMQISILNHKIHSYTGHLYFIFSLNLLSPDPDHTVSIWEILKPGEPWTYCERVWYRSPIYILCLDSKQQLGLEKRKKSSNTPIQTVKLPLDNVNEFPELCRHWTASTLDIWSVPASPGLISPRVAETLGPVTWPQVIIQDQWSL